MQQRPFDRPYKPNGGYYTGGTDELLLHNAVQILSEETSYTDNYRFIGSFWAEAQIIKGLTGQGVVQQRLGLHLRLHLLQPEPPLCRRQGPHPGPEPVRDDQHDRPLRQL